MPTSKHCSRVFESEFAVSAAMMGLSNLLHFSTISLATAKPSICKKKHLKILSLSEVGEENTSSKRNTSAFKIEQVM